MLQKSVLKGQVMHAAHLLASYTWSKLSNAGNASAALKCGSSAATEAQATTKVNRDASFI
jgi:hypothetical protein